jgi:DNA-binding MarR family transcriptional regulator
MDDAKFQFFSGLLDETARIRGRTLGLFALVRAEAGLSEMEMTVLNALAGATSPPTVPRIGRSLGHPRQVIQRAANALVARGLIATTPNPDHKRALLLMLTPKGREIKHSADVTARRLAEPILDGLDASVLRAAADVLHDIRLAIDANARSLADHALADQGPATPSSSERRHD